MKELEKIIIEINILNNENVIVEIKNALQEKDSKAYHIWRTNEYNVNHVFYGENTLLHYATAKNRIEIMKDLIKNGANVDAVGLFELTPLHLASIVGHIEAMKVLLENGANINATNELGDTPFHAGRIFAPTRLKTDVMTVLLEYGANANIV